MERACRLFVKEESCPDGVGSGTCVQAMVAHFGLSQVIDLLATPGIHQSISGPGSIRRLCSVSPVGLVQDDVCLSPHGVGARRAHETLGPRPDSHLESPMVAESVLVPGSS